MVADRNELLQRHRAAIAGEPLPLAYVDLDAMEANVDAALIPVAAAKKTLRIASKSIRSVELLRLIQQRAGAAARGIMAYAVREAAFLFERGFDDLLVAYPTLSLDDAAVLASMTARGASVSIVADCEEHLAVLETAAAREQKRLAVIVEVDTSYRPLDGAVHVGVRRSPLCDAAAVIAFCERVARSPHLLLRGLMGYEAHIAGLPDNNPFSPLLNTPKRALKALARPAVRSLRAQLAAGLAKKKIELEIFNGGGTGSLSSSSEEDVLTEVTAGSGFLCSHLFDYYEGSPFRPAIFFALQAVRRPRANIVTCHGGGYIASGEAGADRLPVVWWPEGAKLIALEGAGEVQTPVVLPEGAPIVELGTPVIFRHAKAGELAEHFNEYLLLSGRAERGYRLSGRAKTYRGDGYSFLG